MSPQLKSVGSVFSVVASAQLSLVIMAQAFMPHMLHVGLVFLVMSSK